MEKQSPVHMKTQAGDPKPFAVVTGASSGIGLELALQCAEHGFDLLVTATGPSIEEAARTIEALGARVHTLQTDLATFEGVEALYAAVRSINRPMDVLAINAGISVGGDFARQTVLTDELRLIDLNVTSTVHLTKLAVRDMVARGAGRILFTSSIAALMPGPFQAVYNASKAFIYSFAEAIRSEVKDSGGSITVLLPGPTDTGLFERAGMQATKVGTSKKDDPADVARAAFEALMAGKDQVVASSLKTRLMATAARAMPATVSAEQDRQLAEPGSAQTHLDADGT
jgi:short-subunit dehydrogenase